MSEQLISRSRGEKPLGQQHGGGNSSYHPVDGRRHMKFFCDTWCVGNEDAMVMRRHSISCPSLSVVIKRRSQKSCGGNGGRYRKDLQGLNR
uniref:Uncharacterized protein n=1 Tax=Daphnia galeata TaxID=27404 RepID=A0A8J2WFY9_9CRUS|nr:unnamed protein product [Daphnia galeata]